MEDDFISVNDFGKSGNEEDILKDFELDIPSLVMRIKNKVQGDFMKKVDKNKVKNVAEQQIDAIKKIESEVSEKNESEGQKREEEPDDVIFLRNAVEILANEHNIDSQGIYEYMKEIIDIRLGPEGRKKVWKKLRGDDEKSTRYVRCLVLNIDNQSYIIDVDAITVRPFDEKEFEQEDPVFIPYKRLERDWDERYDGS